jgi:general secretion pathway protein G
MFTMICGSVGCSNRQRLRNEPSLRKSLFVLRTEIDQFTLDHQRRPTSLSELVSGGYIKQIPFDPITGRNDTWRIEKSDEYFDVLDVRSGSDAISK